MKWLTWDSVVKKAVIQLLSLNSGYLVNQWDLDTTIQTMKWIPINLAESLPIWRIV